MLLLLHSLLITHFNEWIIEFIALIYDILRVALHQAQLWLLPYLYVCVTASPFLPQSLVLTHVVLVSKVYHLSVLILVIHCLPYLATLHPHLHVLPLHVVLKYVVPLWHQPKQVASHEFRPILWCWVLVQSLYFLSTLWPKQTNNEVPEPLLADRLAIWAEPVKFVFDILLVFCLQ